jgi:hypothetical protein
VKIDCNDRGTDFIDAKIHIQVLQVVRRLIGLTKVAT